ncbi:MAG: ATP-dependent RecD-like DNA helicase [Peptococcaceae bacterium]|nr:ATP-dependent RecD-like DNA helicase [Peptococcaceae bacterium]
MDTIYGFLERISYQNEETQFTVAKLKEKGKQDLTTIVGSLAGVSPGESLKLTGRWVYSKKFGEQFQVEKYESVVPATVNGIEKYLGSGLIKGIGPVMARRIVRVFGLDTIDVIENNPGELARVEGIGPKRIATIAGAWAEQKEIKEIMVFLQGHGVSAGYSAKIFKKYGRASIETVRNNPYRLAADIHGIGFVTADRIARNLGFDPSSVMRAGEGVIYALNEFMNGGHVYCPYGLLVEKASQLLKVDREVVAEAVAGLFADGRIVLEDLNRPGEDPRPNHKAVYLPPFYTAETGLARGLLSLKEGPSCLRPVDAEKTAARAEGKLGIRLAGKQKEAVALALENKVLVITGGPGTGKTTIIRAILEIYQALGLRVLLAAPTGRAAKRMQEAAGHEARTIHRLLEFSYQAGGFQRNREYPLEADAVIVDEASMIDTILMYHLVKAIPEHATLILVGDVNQLPSVGPGSVLKDIIESGRFRVVTLTEIFRQAVESRIVSNAHRIIRGEFPDLSPPRDGGPEDFYFIEEEDPEKAVNKILALCTERIPRHFGFHPVDGIQVLTPMHRGEAGVANLNSRLQEALNPGGDGVSRGYRTFKVKDKVMQVVNNYEKDVYNGDIGRITFIDREEQEVRVEFDGREVSYDFPELDELAPAYAVSIHKSQGSEYPAVIIPVLTQHYVLLQRNLIYTGITRGKRLVVLVGSKKALAIAIRNNKPQERHTRLRERLVTQQGAGILEEGKI